MKRIIIAATLAIVSAIALSVSMHPRGASPIKFSDVRTEKAQTFKTQPYLAHGGWFVEMVQ